MTVTQGTGAPHLTVVGAGQRPADGQGIRALLADGSAAIAVGSLVAGGFVTETMKSLATGEKPGRLWFVFFTALGLVIMALGFWLRRRSRLGVHVGIVVNAVDARRGRARAEQRDQQAERFSQSSAAVTLKAEIELSGDAAEDRKLICLHGCDGNVDGYADARMRFPTDVDEHRHRANTGRSGNGMPLQVGPDHLFDCLPVWLVTEQSDIEGHFATAPFWPQGKRICPP
ncbi:hypothetical protein ABT297_22680 [Dactylosporangium sp. NPDC000555]|uniref:hypothetical protein n=1 Tax=Dactylosporangium sp. NPDC000555 TaxID=3154260 RepID=UPI00331808C8